MKTRRDSKAAGKHRSHDDVLVDSLGPVAGVEVVPPFDDLDHLVGKWEEDPGFDAALAAQDLVDEEMWR